MLVISAKWLCLFFENGLILNKIAILGQPPGDSQSFAILPTTIWRIDSPWNYRRQEGL